MIKGAASYQIHEEEFKALISKLCDPQKKRELALNQPGTLLLRLTNMTPDFRSQVCNSVRLRILHERVIFDDGRIVKETGFFPDICQSVTLRFEICNLISSSGDFEILPTKPRSHCFLESYNIHMTPELSQPGCHMEPFYGSVPNKGIVRQHPP
ncbi:hypothetical protein J6590_086097 [Homalodisca vitripennis]|nr:hypothetical protein J6590_086097 [Homalodisca vitripennis]